MLSYTVSIQAELYVAAMFLPQQLFSQTVTFKKCRSNALMRHQQLNLVWSSSLQLEVECLLLPSSLEMVTSG